MNKLHTIKVENLDKQELELIAEERLKKGKVYRGLAYMQGNRQYVSFVGHVNDLLEHIDLRNLEPNLKLQDKKAQILRNSLADTEESFKNRALDEKHSSEFTQYLNERLDADDTFLIPSLIYAVSPEDKVSLFVEERTRDDDPMFHCLLWIDQSVVFPPVDGLHRTFSLYQLRRQRALRFDLFNINVILMCESDQNKIKESFSDAAKTKPLDKSLTGVYRGGFEKTLIAILKAVQLTGFIKKEGSLLKKSEYPYFISTFNAMRRVVVDLIFGGYEKKVKDLSEDEIEMVTQFFLNLKQVEGWNEIITTSTYIPNVTTKTPVLRTIARAAYELHKDKKDWTELFTFLNKDNCINKRDIWLELGICHEKTNLPKFTTKLASIKFISQNDVIKPAAVKLIEMLKTSVGE